ncbi:aspartate aminotransferase [Purpureocillium lavendulum]|uniref:Aspartate aminotransferase n=1 Tax=Purpureocillium lavendulum TaxID=1247861 RepID=A0AB34G0P8_9HYPO|nr:aspartate aminotransferase [Purpureocillium lavendulum]
MQVGDDPTVRAAILLQRENYKAFGADVRALHSSLGQLESAIKRAQTSLISHGAQSRDILGGDQTSLSEIVGDYEATLVECERLLWDNRRYAQTTGPATNINWNINVMPQVDYLRSRIQMHNTRIQHVLKPFEIDLINNFHGDLAQRITSLHVDVLRVNRNIDTLIAQHYPDVAAAIEQRLEQELCSVRIPDPLLGRLGGMFDRHKLGRPPALHEMADCFLIQFEKSTVILPISVDDDRQSPPVDQYLALLKCQLVMDRMKDTNELRNPRRMSHWPGYVRALEEKLSQQSSRFETELTTPDVSNCEDKRLEIWNSDDKPTKTSHPAIGPLYIDVVEVALAKESAVTAWRTVRVSRQAHAENRFRLVETCASRGEPPVVESRVIDINMRKATLIPIYADPVGKAGKTPPLEIVLEDKASSYRFLFMDLRDLFLFQQAFTDFKVAESFMEPGKEESFEEDTTLQLWIPSPMKERSGKSREDDDRRPSSGSQDRVPVEPDRKRLRMMGAIAARISVVDVPTSASLPLRAGPIDDVDWAALRRTRNSPAMLVTAAEVVKRSKPTDTRLAFVHGDLWQGNMLWEGTDVTAILDWDASGLGSPGIDLGSVRFDAALFYGLPAIMEVLDGWEHESGRLAPDVAYWDVVAALATPPNMRSFQTAMAEQGRPDLTAELLNQRREEFLRQALRQLDVGDPDI